MKPTAITRGVPNRSTTEPIFVEENATSAPAGRKASAVFSADQPSRDERVLVEEWRDVLALHARTICELDRELHQHGLGAGDFEVLDVLAEKPASGDDCTFRVQELSSRVHLSQSALSRLIARLEKDGLVTRGMCSEDRRGVQVKLTEASRARHREVRPLQRAVLSRMLPDPSA